MLARRRATDSRPVLLWGVITGPICTPLSSPLPTVRRRFSDRLTKCLLRVAYRHRHRNREAPLSRTSKSAVGNNLRRHPHVRVGQHDHMILRASLALRALAIRCRRGHKCSLRNRSRSHEADRPHLRMIDAAYRPPPSPPFTRLTTPFGKPVFSINSKAQLHGQRHALRGLEDQACCRRQSRKAETRTESSPGN